MSDGSIPLGRRDAGIAIGLALVMLLCGSVRMAPGVCGSFHDDAIYVSTASALASGQGYRLVDVPGAPLQTKYPILYPAILSVIWYVWPSFPANLLAMQAVTLLFGAATVAMGYLYLVRFGYFSRAIAASAGVICATAPYFLYFAVQTMAEMPFALLSIVALWGVESYLLRPDMGKRKQFAWGAALALPFLCRTIGATLIVAGLGVLLFHRRPLRWYTAGTVCAALGWIMWSLAGRGIWDTNPVDGYYTDYLGCWSSTGVSLVGRVFSKNLLMTAHGSAELPFEGLSAAMAAVLGRGYTNVLIIIAGLAPWLTMIPDLRRGRALAWMLAASLGAMLVWSWPPYRFLVPIMPFLAAYLLHAPATILPAPSAQRRWRVAGVLVVIVIVLANCGLLARHALEVRRTGFLLARLTDAPVDWSSYERTFAWLRQNSKPQDVIAAGLDSMVALYTDRRAVRPFVYDPGPLFYGDGPPELQTPQKLADILKAYQPRYLVESPMPGFMEEQPLARVLNELRQLYPGWLVVAHRDADPRFVVFELDATHEP
ncbi:MAG: hypothetical protein WD845_03415 [Pirellulales bacterium]